MEQARRSWGSRLKKFLRLSLGEKFLLLEAWVTLGVARGLVLTLPFRWIAPRLRVSLAASPAASGRAQAEAVGWAVRVASRYTPWRSNCLAQGIAGKRMLQRRGLASTLVLGVRKDDKDEFEAHAWLDFGRVRLTGGTDNTSYSVVSSFADKKNETPAAGTG